MNKKEFISNIKKFCDYSSFKFKDDSIILENVYVKKPIKFGEHSVLKAGSTVDSIAFNSNRNVTLTKNNKSKTIKPSILNEAFYFPGITDLYGNIIQQDEMGTDIVGMTNITTTESVLHETKAVLLDIINKISSLSVEELNRIECILKKSFSVEDEIMLHMINDIKNKSEYIV